MIAVLIALYGAGMMMMVMLVHMADVENPRIWTGVAAVFFWPFVVVVCYIMAAIEMITEAWKGN